VLITAQQKQRGINSNVLMHECNVGSSTIYNLKAPNDDLLNLTAGSDSRITATSECKTL
jgi:hypothetical protein